MEQEGKGRDRRMTPDEARAVIRLWSRRQWEREHWPTVADVAEGLGIEASEAEALLAEVRMDHPPAPNPGGAGGERLIPLTPPGLGAGGPFRLATAAVSLTGFFCLYLERLLA